MLVIHWFRQDLRLEDNPALANIPPNTTVLPIYIFDDKHRPKLGGASCWWLHHSLEALNQSLNGNLRIFKGKPLNILLNLCIEYDISTIYWNRLYEANHINRDTKIKKTLNDKGIQIHSHNGFLLKEPFEVNKKDGSPYRVFTPFYRQHYADRHFQAPRNPKPYFDESKKARSHALSLQQLTLLPDKNWDAEFYTQWEVGEKAAQRALDTFIEHGLEQYLSARDEPGIQGLSRLSAHLHFGEISPTRIWNTLQSISESPHSEQFKKELVWREFSYHLLYYFPTLNNDNWNARFNHFPYRNNKHALTCWQQGQTGHPFVDAGMRELRQTGSMHNRLRMICASFLVKNLLIHWHEGERWFWDNLLDADLASNSASWQWVAGCGADAAPFFRIFNPCTQGEKFDKHGAYTRKFVPELTALPNKYLYRPWEAPKDILEKAGIRLGEHYPHPIVDLRTSREEALTALAEMKMCNEAQT